MVIISNVIWIDENIDNEESKGYRKELEKIWYLKVKCFKDTKEAIDYLKEIEFKETKIIVNGGLYIEFINIFIENLREINVIPKIIIFEKEKELFIQNNQQYFRDNNLSFYNSWEIKTTFKEIKNFLIDPNSQNKLNKKQEDNIQMTFEYIDSELKLALPIFYKTLIETAPNDKIESYTNFIYDNYSKGNKEIKYLLAQIKSLQDIPIELLSKYYIRAYTLESNFYKDINADLGLNKKEKHLSFFKTLYEGTKLKSLPLASNNILYRGSLILNDEIKKIKNYLEKKLKIYQLQLYFLNHFYLLQRKEN